MSTSVVPPGSEEDVFQPDFEDSSSALHTLGLEKTAYAVALLPLPPGQATEVVGARIRQARQINDDVVEFFKERAAIEEAYVRGLQELCQRRNSITELKSFSPAFDSLRKTILAQTASHSKLSQKLRAELSTPLLSLESSHSLEKALENLTILSQKHELATQKVSHYQNKSAKKSTPAKLENSEGELRDSRAQWESSAPFLFESLETVETARLVGLKDILVKLCMLEVEKAQTGSAEGLEQVMNQILGLNVEREISAWANTLATQQIRRLDSAVSATSQTAAATGTTRTPRSRNSFLSVPGTHHSQSQPSPSRPISQSVFSTSTNNATEDSGSIHSASKRRSRFGTILRQGRWTKGGSPDKKRKEKEMRSPPRKAGSIGDDDVYRASHTGQRSNGVGLGEFGEIVTTDSHAKPDGLQRQSAQDTPREELEAAANSPKHSNNPFTQLPSPPSKAAANPNRFSVIPEAEPTFAATEQESLSTNDEMLSSPPLRVEIQQAVISEEPQDMERAMSMVSTTLRSQNTIRRERQGTRGRRGVSMIGPSPEEGLNDVRSGTKRADTGDTFRTTDFGREESFAQKDIAGGVMSGKGMTTSVLTPPPRIPAQVASDTPTAKVKDSDTQSLVSVQTTSSSHSGRHALARHGDLEGSSGLNISVLESVSALFDSLASEDGMPAKMLVTGEVALRYHPQEGDVLNDVKEIRLDGWERLEQAVPNKAILTGGQGVYSLNYDGLSQRAAGVLALKYKLKDGSAHAPILLRCKWKMEDDHVSVIVSYSMNPELSTQKGLQKLALLVGLDGAGVLACQSKPQGHFSGERGHLLWQIGDLSGTEGDKLLARFTVESGTGIGRKGVVDVKWEIDGKTVSGIDLESAEGVNVSRRTVSAKYYAN